jgi:uncharacterized protein YecE (DUF72 family)
VTVRVGIGGWTYEPWRGLFYPEGLPHKRELEHAARQLTTIEINATFYSRQKPESWRRWRDAVPDGFQFSLKASRFSTARKVLADSAGSIEVFLSQGFTELGPKLGPINWQFADTKAALDGWASQAQGWSKGGRDVYIVFIAGAKIRNPAAAQALVERLRRPAPDAPPDSAHSPPRRPALRR